MAVSDDEHFYMLKEADLGALATAAPRRVPRPGKADIGGRMRVASILRGLGLEHAEMPERIAGSTNEVWRAGNYIIRVAFETGAERLRREAKLAALLPEDIHYPKVIASGIEPFGEWIVVRHRPGRVLSQEWLRLDGPNRKLAVGEFAQALKALHSLKIEPEHASTVAFGQGNGQLNIPYQLGRNRMLSLIEIARCEPYTDQGLLNAAEERVNELSDVFWAHERFGLIHGDLHFENILFMDGVLVAMLDFEWSRVGPQEIDIDVLARFCSEPELHVGGNYPARAEDYKDVLRWLNEFYPELFAHAFLKERLTLCALSFELASLVITPPTAPASELFVHHPLNRLKTLLTYGSHAERLGWMPKGDYEF